MGRYKIEKQTVRGEEVILMNSDIFFNFFCEVMDYNKNVDKELVEYTKSEYEKSKLIKRKRIRFKREKIALTAMYNMMVSC